MSAYLGGALEGLEEPSESANVLVVAEVAEVPPSIADRRDRRRGHHGGHVRTRRRRPRPLLPAALPLAAAARRRRRGGGARRAPLAVRAAQAHREVLRQELGRVGEGVGRAHAPRLLPGRRAQGPRAGAGRHDRRGARVVRRRPRRRRGAGARPRRRLRDRRLDAAHRAQVRRGGRRDHAEPGAGGARRRARRRAGPRRQGAISGGGRAQHAVRRQLVRPRVVARERRAHARQGEVCRRAQPRAPRTLGAIRRNSAQICAIL